MVGQISKTEKINGVETTIDRFESLDALYKYITTTPLNKHFQWGKLASTEGDTKWYGTSNFDEAVDLFKNGWKPMAQKLTTQLKTKTSTEVQKAIKQTLSVAGFQPVVPLYLSNVPTNMINTTMVAKKQKVLNVIKMSSYSAMVTTEQIIESSTIALQVVQKLEAQGYRINLYVCFAAKTHDHNSIPVIKIKSANERLNVAKTAFPMVHPSMLRRLMFRYIEVEPHITKQFVGGYGKPMKYYDIKQYFKNDIVLPALLDQSHLDACNGNIENMVSEEY